MDTVFEKGTTTGTPGPLRKFVQGSYPFSGTNFQDYSRTQIDFSRALNFTIILHSQDVNVNSPYGLP